MNCEVAALRVEYDSLVRIADGLIEMIHRNQACNITTFARMADEARAAARALASLIERMVLEFSSRPSHACPSSASRPTFFHKIYEKLKSLLLAV